MVQRLATEVKVKHEHLGSQVSGFLKLRLSKFVRRRRQPSRQNFSLIHWISFGSLSVFGCRTGIPAWRAYFFTALSEGCCPRPLGRSGCVSTYSTQILESWSSASSVGTANVGVPAKGLLAFKTLPRRAFVL